MAERHKLKETPLPLVSDLPNAPRTTRETMTLWADAFDNHVGAPGFQSNNVSDLKIAVHSDVLKRQIPDWPQCIPGTARSRLCHFGARSAVCRGLHDTDHRRDKCAF
jgi:hypothetical protein